MPSSSTVFLPSCLILIMALQVICSVIPGGPNNTRNPRQVILDQPQTDAMRSETSRDENKFGNEEINIQNYLSEILRDEPSPTKDTFIVKSQPAEKWEDKDLENNEERQLTALAKNSPQTQTNENSRNYNVKSVDGNEDEEEKEMYKSLVSHKIGFGAFSPVMKTITEVSNNDSSWLDESVSQIRVKPRRGLSLFSPDKQKALIEVETALLSLLKASQKAGITTQDIAEHLHQRLQKRHEE